MTKFEYLAQDISKNPPEYAEVVKTWIYTGCQTIYKSTSYYSKDTIYWIRVQKSPLYGCLVFCLEDTHAFIEDKNNKTKKSTIDWENAQIIASYRDQNNFIINEISFGNNVVSARFKFLISEDQLKVTQAKLPSGWKDDFVPYKNQSTSSTGSVIMPEDIYRRCLSPLGVPFVQEDELEYSKKEIMELAIQPALEEYFHWVPPVIVTVHTADGDFAGDEASSWGWQVKTDRDGNIYAENEEEWKQLSSSNAGPNGSMDIYFPTDNQGNPAYGVVGLSLQQNGTTVGGNATSPLFYAIEQSLYGGFNYSALSGSFTGNSPYTNTSSIGGMLTTRAASQAVLNYTRRIHYEGPYEADIDHPKGKWIRIYSNTMGVFNVWWAISSLNFNNVEYANRRRVVEYAQACVKELFGNLRRQAKSDIPGRFEYDKWISEAEKTKETITNEWKKLVKYSGIIRGSL